MRSTMLGFGVVVLCGVLWTQQPSTPVTGQQAADPVRPATLEARPQDVDTVEHLVSAMYASVSGPAGAQDLSRFRTLFRDDATMMPSGRGKDGAPYLRITPIDVFLPRAAEVLKTQGYFERPVVTHIEQHDHWAVVTSSYEVRKTTDQPQPDSRGINSMTLHHDGRRWAIISLYWMTEDAAHPLPANLFPKK